MKNPANICSCKHCSTLAEKYIGLRVSHTTISHQDALHYIEDHLFEELEITEIARALKTSVSTLIRTLKKTMKTTPYSYIKSRRLEEAHHLLGTGRYSVGDVATWIGYTNFGAFTDAFTLKYGVRPSVLKKKGFQKSVLLE